MAPKSINIDIIKMERSISEEFKSRSPFTQQCIKSFTGTTPTSKVKPEYRIQQIDFSAASPTTQTNIKFWLGIN